MSLFNRTLRAAEGIKGEDTKEVRAAKRMTKLEPREAAPKGPESDLAHALRTRRLPRTPERH